MRVATFNLFGNLIFLTWFVGPDHHLCDAIRRTIKKLEADINTKQVRGEYHQQQRGNNGPYSNLSWHDHDLMNMKRSQSLRQKPITSLPKGFNPGRRGSLQRQDAYRTPHSREDPPPQPITIEPLVESPPVIQEDQVDQDPKAILQKRFASPAREQSIGESVLQYVELPNYEPTHVTPRGSYSTSPKGSPVQGRRSSLGKDILKLALHKVTVDLGDMLENDTDSDENQNVKVKVDRNGEDTENDSPEVEYIDTYSTDAKSLTSKENSSRPKSANVETGSKTILESRPKTAPNAIVNLKVKNSSKGPKTGVRFKQTGHSKSTEDLGANTIVWHTNSTPTTPVSHCGFTPGVLDSCMRVQSAGVLTESGRRRPPRSSTSPVKVRQNSSSERTRKPSIVTYEVHRNKCYIPGPHAIDLHNAYSITPGPHSTIHSLLGDPPCPRPTFQYHHGSAWYQIPGRSPLDKNASMQLRHMRRSYSASSVRVYDLDPRTSWSFVNWNDKQTGMTQSASWSEDQFHHQ